MGYALFSNSVMPLFSFLQEFVVFTISAFIALINCANTDTPIADRGFLSMGPGWMFAYNAFYIATPVVADGFLVRRD